MYTSFQEIQTLFLSSNIPGFGLLTREDGHVLVPSKAIRLGIHSRDPFLLPPSASFGIRFHLCPFPSPNLTLF